MASLHPIEYDSERPEGRRTEPKANVITVRYHLLGHCCFVPSADGSGWSAGSSCRKDSLLERSQPAHHNASD